MPGCSTTSCRSAATWTGPIFEGWTLLAALAAQTSRLRLGLMVTSNRLRPPAVLAKIATTVDIVSGGQLDFGIGAGSRPSVPIARREYGAHGLPFHDAAYAVGSLAEACTIIRRLWSQDTPFDYDGTYHHLQGAFGNPKPAQRSGPPTSGASPGGDIATAIGRSAMLDRFCADIGRDPAAITRPIVLPISWDHLQMTRAAVTEALAAGFPHIVLGLSAPYADGVIQRVAEEIIEAHAVIG